VRVLAEEFPRHADESERMVEERHGHGRSHAVLVLLREEADQSGKEGLAERELDLRVGDLNRTWEFELFTSREEFRVLLLRLVDLDGAQELQHLVRDTPAEGVRPLDAFWRVGRKIARGPLKEEAG